MSALDREVTDKAAHLAATYGVNFKKLESGNYLLTWNRKSPYYTFQTLGVIKLDYTYTLGGCGYRIFHTEDIERFVRSCLYAGADLPRNLKAEARSLCEIEPLYRVSAAAA
jgi:hypothetical protein